MEPTNDNQSARVFYVYAWLRPCGTPFYIGKGKGKRAEKMKTGIVFKHIVAKIIASGSVPKIVKLHQGLTEREALDLEVIEIAKHGRRSSGGTLVNLTEGGEGTSGHEHTDESRAKMSASSRLSPAKAGLFKGVSAVKRNGKWIAHIWLDGKLIHIGYFNTADEAARAYDDRAFHEWGSDCYRNFPNEEPRLPLPRRVPGEVWRMSPPSSGLKGACLNKKNGKWRSIIVVGGRQKQMGHFATEEGAARAYDKAAYAAWGDKCYLNFPDEVMLEAA